MLEVPGTGIAIQALDVTFNPWSIRTLSISNCSKIGNGLSVSLHSLKFSATRSMLRIAFNYATTSFSTPSLPAPTIKKPIVHGELRPVKVMRSSLKPALWRPAVCHPPIDPPLTASMYSRGSNITPGYGHITLSTLAASG